MSEHQKHAQTIRAEHLVFNAPAIYAELVLGKETESYLKFITHYPLNGVS